MKLLQTALMASLVSLAFSVPVFAQGGGGGEIENGRFMYVGMDGKMVMLTGNDKSKAMMMKMGKQVKAGTIFYMSDGKLYMAEDKKMPDGLMAWQMMRDSAANAR